MSTPFGYVGLFDAVDAVGRALYLSVWRPFREFGDDHIPASSGELIRAGFFHNREDPAQVDFAKKQFKSRWRAWALIDQTDPAIERVVCAFADACASGRIGTAYRTHDGGVEDIDPSEWFSQLKARGYFVKGIITVHLPSLDDQGRPVPDTSVPCEREILVCRDDRDRYVAELKPVSAAPPEGELVPVTNAVESPSPVADPTASTPDPKPRKKRRGPERGTVDRFGEDDRALFSDITNLKKTKNLTAQEAARELGNFGRIKKRGSLDSAVLRLARRYRKEVERKEDDLN